jgi:quercetin dioxygenase-like cupin family protein
VNTPRPQKPLDTKVLVRGEESEGRVAWVENTLPARWEGPPLHHHAFDEVFYVIEGEVTFQIGDALRTAGPGEVVFAPGGAHHTLANLSDAPARYALVITPAGFERYFLRLAAEAAGVDPPPEALEPLPEVTRVGPPIALE